MVDVFKAQSSPLKTESEDRMFAAILLAKFGYFEQNELELINFINQLYENKTDFYKQFRVYGLMNERGLGRYFELSKAKSDYEHFRDHEVTWIKPTLKLDRAAACRQSLNLGTAIAY